MSKSPRGHDAVMAEAPDRVGELGLVGRHRPALARRDDLARVEREAAHHAERRRRAYRDSARRARRPRPRRARPPGARPSAAPPTRPGGRRGARRARPSFASVTASATRARSRLNVSGSTSTSTARRAAELDDVRRRRERVGGDDHLVAGADPERHHREVQRGRAGRDDDRVGGAAGRREALLELRHLRAHRQHPRRDDLGERGDLGLADVRAGEADRLGHDVAHDPAGRCSRYQSIVRSSPRRAPPSPRTRAGRAPCPCSGSAARRRRSRAA